MLLNLSGDEWRCMNGEGIMPCSDAYPCYSRKVEVVVGKRKKRNGRADDVSDRPN